MSITKKPSNKKTIPDILGGTRLWEGMLLAVMLLSIAWAIYFAVSTIFIPYQIEFREGTAMVTTKIILGGGNPYVFKNQPLGINVYGAGYSLAVLPFAFIFGNTLVVHRTLTFIFILLSALLAAMTIYKTRKNPASAVAGAAFVMVGLIGHGGIGASPAAMGSFLFLAAILIPLMRSFDRISLCISALAALLAFYTKPYFVFSVAVVAIYLFLFVTKKSSLFYGILFLFLFTLSFVVVRIMCPLYFINVIIANIFLTAKSTRVLIDNLKNLLLVFYPVLTLAVLFVAKDWSSKVWQPAGRGDQSAFNFPDWDKPLINHSVNYLFYAFASSLLVFLFILGSHDGGTGMNYAYQFLTPLFFCWFFEKINLGTQLRFIVVPVLLFNLFAWEKEILQPSMLAQKDSKEWAELFDYIESSSNILNSQTTVSKTVEMGLNPIDSGQTILYYEILPFPENALLGPSYEALYADGFQYVTYVDRAIEKQKFDLIITTMEKSDFFHIKRLSQYYSVVNELTIEMPQTAQIWTALVWKPLPK
jgi:hypothetical protein